MAILHTLSIHNFRGLKSFDATFGPGIQCIIGRGDTCKTTILEAISCLLSSSYTLQFSDADFYNGDANQDIDIRAVLTNLPDSVLKRHANCLCGIDKNGVLRDDFESEDMENAECAIQIFLRVSKDLEPRWTVEARDKKENISANSRSELGMVFINEYSDRHFSFSRGGFLYRKAKEGEELMGSQHELCDIVRDAKNKINDSLTDKFPNTITKIQNTALELGLDELVIAPHIDARDIMVGEGSLSLSTNNIPLRRIGKGSRKLLSAAIQLSDTGNGIILIDELEVGLEPDRIINLINGLRRKPQAQIIMTTHSSTVLQELNYHEVLLRLNETPQFITFSDSEQSLLRSNPSAFFSKRIIVCEGRTEYGFLRAFEAYRRSSGKKSMTSYGVVHIDGNGAEMIKKCERLMALGYKCLLFCDSDRGDMNQQKALLESTGVIVIDCQGTYCFEQQLFNDAPWQFIVDDFNTHEKHANQVHSSLYNIKPTDKEWYAIEDAAIRESAGKCAYIVEKKENGAEKEKAWYKSISDGEDMGNMFFKYFKQMNRDTHLYQNITRIDNWIENGCAKISE